VKKVVLQSLCIILLHTALKMKVFKDARSLRYGPNLPLNKNEDLNKNKEVN